MCDSTFNRILYQPCSRKNLFNNEQIPSIEWSCDKDTRLTNTWMIEGKDNIFSEEHLSKEMNVADKRKWVLKILNLSEEEYERLKNVSFHT